jgi:uncharacterized membrane protein
MAKKESHVIIAYFSGTDQADAAVDQLKAWDKATDAIKLGGMGILTWKDGKVHTRKVGARATGTGANGGVTLVGGAVAGAAGGAVAGALFHKNLGLSDDDKARLDKHLQQGGAAVVVMAQGDEVEPTEAELASLGGEVEDYKVPEETVSQVEEATDVKPVDE